MTTPDEVATPGPLCDETEFAELIDQMVAENAPRVFAVVQELGDRVDGWIAAWGMAFEDRVEVIGSDGSLRMTCRLPRRRCGVTAGVVACRPGWSGWMPVPGLAPNCSDRRIGGLCRERSAAACQLSRRAASGPLPLHLSG